MVKEFDEATYSSRTISVPAHLIVRTVGPSFGVYNAPTHHLPIRGLAGKRLATGIGSKKIITISRLVPGHFQVGNSTLINAEAQVAQPNSQNYKVTVDEALRLKIGE